MSMKRPYSLLLASFLTLFAVADGLAAMDNQFTAIAYHDVVRTREELASDAVTVDHLIDQFEWLRANQYHPVSIDDLLAARAGKKSLPKRAVLLCWDDGYASFYNLVFPLLKAYDFPAVLALEGSWIEPDPSKTVHYGTHAMPRSHFLSWRQLRELAASPLVEIASHSHDLHRGVLADRFGTRLPAVIAHVYNPGTHHYESDQEQFERIRRDLEKNSRLIQKRLGVRPRVMVWPFGRYNQTALAAARKVGMAITLTLDPVPGDLNNLNEIGRVYPTLNPDLADFRGYLDPHIRPPVRHFFKVDSRRLLDASPDTEKRFSAFLDRVKRLRPGMVSLAPIIHEKGKPRALFPNSVMALAQDRLGRLTWHTAHRGGVDVFLWLPSELFDAGYLSGERGEEFFSAMGRFAFCQGVIVDSPALVNTLFTLPAKTHSDAPAPDTWNPARRKMARERLGKTDIGPGATGTLAKLAALQKWQPFLEVGLILPPARLPELSPQRMANLLRYVDFILVDARAGSAAQAAALLDRNLLSPQTDALFTKVYFLLAREKDDEELVRLLAALPRHDIINWGYEYDDFLNGQPQPDVIGPLISDAEDPFE